METASKGLQGKQLCLFLDLKGTRKEKASSPRGWVEEKELIKDQMGWILSKEGTETAV